MHLGIRRFLALLGIVAVLGAVAVAILLPGWRDHLKDFSEHEIEQALKAVMGNHVEFDRQLTFDIRAERSQDISFKRLVVRPAEGAEPILSAEEVIIELDPWTVVKMATPAVLRVTFRKPRITIRRNEDGTLNFVTLVKSVRDYRATHRDELQGSKERPTINIVDGTIEIIDERYLDDPIVLEQMNLEIGGGAQLDALAGVGKLGVNGFSADGKWKFGGEITESGERIALDKVWLTGNFISLDDGWEGRLHGAVGELWRGLEPRGVLREIRLEVEEKDGDLLIKTELDASELEFALLQETIGERVENFTADVSIGQGGTVVTARAVGKPPEATAVAGGPDVLFVLEGKFGSASDYPGHDSLGLKIQDLHVDGSLRKSLTKLVTIGRGLRGKAGDDVQRDLDKIWGEKIARSIFDRHQPRGFLSIDSEILLPRGIEGTLQFQGEVSIRDGSLVVPIGVKVDGSPLDVTLEALKGAFTFVGDNIQVKEGTRVEGRVGESSISFAGGVTNALERQSSTWLADFRAVSLRLSDTLEGLSVDEDNGPHASWLQVVRDYDVKGVADISVKLMGGSGGIPYRMIRILPRGEMSFQHPAFPYPIEGVDGYLDVSGERVDFKLTGLQPPGEAGGTVNRGIIEMKGDIERLGTDTERSEVTIDARKLRIDPDVLAALAQVRPGLGRLLAEELHAAGSIDVALKRTVTPDPTVGRSVAVTNMNIDLLGCTADWAGAASVADGGEGEYRYQLLDLRGQVRVRPDLVVIDNVRGRSVDREEFVFNGHVQHPGTSESTAELTVTAPSLEFSDNLRSLLSTVDNDYVNLWNDFSPTGTIALNYEMQLAAGEIEHTTITIEPRGCTASAVDFRLPVRNISEGRVTITDGHVVIKPALRSIDERTGVIEIEGEIGKGADAIDVTVTAMKLPFNDELFAAVPQGVRDIWSLFDLQGTSHVVAKLDRSSGDPDGDLDIEVTATLQGVDVAYRARPVPLEGVTGSLVYSNKQRDDLGERVPQITFTDLRANVLGGSLAVTTGTIRGSGEDRHASIKVVGERLGLRHEHLPRLDPRIQELLAGLAVSGTVGIDAILVLEGDDLDGLSAQGMLTASELRVQELLIDDISANVFLKERILDLSEIRGTVYGGRLDAELSVDTSAFAAFRGKLEVNGVDVNPFVTDVFGMKDEHKIRGRLAASLDFQGLGPARENLVGRGQIVVRDGWLWQMPFFLQLLDTVPLGAGPMQDERGFRACDATFRIADGMVRFDQIHVDAHTLRVQGKGDMDFDDGALDMIVAASSTPSNKIPLLSDLLSGVATSLIGFAVKGTYKDPILELQPIKIVTDILSGISDSMGADITPKE